MVAGFFRVTQFERKRQIFLRGLIVGAAFLTYLWDKDDVVWRFVKNAGPETRSIERWLFLAATLLIGIGAYLCTASRKTASAGMASRPHAFSSRYVVGQFLYSVGLASLLPLAGFCILIFGETVRLLRLWLAQDDRQALLSGNSTSETVAAVMQLSFSEAVRREAFKWALFISMIVFTVTLRDRYADILIFASILISILVNWGLVRNCWANEQA